ncbi:MAG: (Fe-S)-binding protein [Marinilabiliales bacterium]
MTKQIAFLIVLLITIGIFSYSAYRIYRFFKLTKPDFKVRNFGKRLLLTINVAFFQRKIMRKPVIGFLHALVFWGFCIILFGSVEMVIDGLAGTERILSCLGIVYDVLIAFGDVFAAIVLIAVLVFLFRRLFLHVKRFYGIEMKKKSHIDANIALLIILLLMVSLLGMNTFYITSHPNGYEGVYPVSKFLAKILGHGEEDHLIHEFFWWMHILLIFLFANILPYSKHFHVFMSIPNVFLSRLEPLGKLKTMENITKEVKIMLDPNYNFDQAGEEQDFVRFGVLDAEDVTWKNYLDSLSCTQCGRCTSVCPANITGKKLSPRKVMIDLRARMKERGPCLIKNENINDGKSLLKTYISEEEIWACTTCNACAKECPINIDHPKLIIDMRRYLVMEEAAGPAELNAIFTNIENNGAPWQFSMEDRMLWAENLEMNDIKNK